MDSLIAQEQKTAKNGLTFTGTAVTSGANNRGHTHEYTPSGKIASTSGGTDNKTAGMSANESHGHEIMVYTGGQISISNVYGNTMIGSNIDARDSHDYVTNVTRNGTAGPIIKQASVAHTHTAYFTGTQTSTLDESQNHTHSVTAAGTISGDSETRPANYTMKIWKRIA